MIFNNILLWIYTMHSQMQAGRCLWCRDDLSVIENRHMQSDATETTLVSVSILTNVKLQQISNNIELWYFTLWHTPITLICCERKHYYSRVTDKAQSQRWCTYTVQSTKASRLEISLTFIIKLYSVPPCALFDPCLYGLRIHVYMYVCVCGDYSIQMCISLSASHLYPRQHMVAPESVAG